MKALTSLILIGTKLTQLKSNKEIWSHPSVLLIKCRLRNVPSFSFKEVGLSEIEREIKSMQEIKQHQKVFPQIF